MSERICVTVAGAVLTESEVEYAVKCVEAEKQRLAAWRPGKGERFKCLKSHLDKVFIALGKGDSEQLAKGYGFNFGDDIWCVDLEYGSVYAIGREDNLFERVEK